MGGYFAETGNTQGTSTSYGIYSTASGADTNYGGYFTTTDSLAAANTDYGLYNLLTLTGNAAKTVYGISTTMTSTSTTADILLGNDLLVDQNAAAASGSKTLYGLRSQVLNNGITDASTGTHNLYAGYFSVIGNTGDTQNAYGIYATASGGDANYALYASGDSTITGNLGVGANSSVVAYAGINLQPNLTNLTGLSEGLYLGSTLTTSNTSHYNIYVVNTAVSGAGAVTNNYGLYLANQTQGGTLDYGIYLAGADTNTLYSTQSSSTSGNSSININYTFNSTATSALGYGLYESFTHSNASLTTSNSLYGNYLTFSDTTALANTNYGIFATLPLTGNAAKNTMGIYGGVSTNSTTADTLYGLYGIASQTGANTTGTKKVYGLYGLGSSSNGNGGNSDIYGAIFNATGDTSGTGNAYGIYSTSSGGDSNYALFITGTLPNSIYIDATLSTTGLSHAAIAVGGTITKNGTESFYVFN